MGGKRCQYANTDERAKRPTRDLTFILTYLALKTFWSIAGQCAAGFTSIHTILGRPLSHPLCSKWLLLHVCLQKCCLPGLLWLASCSSTMSWHLFILIADLESLTSSSLMHNSRFLHVLYFKFTFLTALCLNSFTLIVTQI